MRKQFKTKDHVQLIKRRFMKTFYLFVLLPLKRYCLIPQPSPR
jgi:hypothetical protein